MHLKPAALLIGLLVTIDAQPGPSWVPKVRAWIEANQQAVVSELLDLLAIPNVAADRANIRRNAEHLRAMMQKRGLA